jgi:hypothetical protein
VFAAVWFKAILLKKDRRVTGIHTSPARTREAKQNAQPQIWISIFAQIQEMARIRGFVI